MRESSSAPKSRDMRDKWLAHYSPFGVADDQLSWDGAARDDIYYQQPLRVLFVLKETNAWNADIRPSLSEGDTKWMMLARWAVGILNNFPEYDRANDPNVRRQALQATAVINIKKTAGTSSTDMHLLNRHAYFNRLLLKEQIESLSPHLILACGTFDQLFWILEPTVTSMDDLESDFVTCGQSTLVRWRHFGRVNASLSYEKLGQLLRPWLAARTTMISGT